MTDNTDRTLGKLCQSVDDLRVDVGRLEKIVRELEAHANRQKGGWFVITVMSGAAATIGGLIGRWWANT